ncbi:MAG: T9SS type A sorting domain-containing protein [Flavobacteriales bacterium]|nr:T9SS type A sorting domain-containing protein [Flavobacteriales bacterium]
MGSIERYTDNEFYFVGNYYKDLCIATGAPRMYPVLGKMDSLGTIQWASHYVLNTPYCSTGAGDLMITSQHDVVVWGNAIMKLDTLGTLFWARRLDDQVQMEFIKELPGGDLLAGFNIENIGAAVGRLDTDGNFLWLKSYFRPLGRVHDALVESDGSVLITGYTEFATTHAFEPYLPGFHPKLFTLKLDGNGDVLWCQGYSTAPFHWYTPNSSRIVRAQDGNAVVLANIGVPTQNFQYRPLLMKLDANGDTLWTRSSGHVNYAYETRSLLAYSDGSYIYNGRIWGTMPDGTQNNWAYLFKTDSLGHLPCFEVHYPMVISPLFPVDSSFTLTSYDGGTRHPAFITDTVYDPIVVYDACTFTTQIRPPVPRTRPMRVRPNPTTGQFMVEFPEPLLKQCHFSVYDTTGRLLYQRPLPTGATWEQIDLSRFGRGTYLLKVTTPEGSCHERVVVE